MTPEVELRIAVERKIADEIAKALIGRGYVLRVYDGEDYACSRTTDPNVVAAAMMSTDEDVLLVYEAGKKERIGWIQFVYGNDGFDVVSDYTTNLEDHVGPIVGKYH